MRSWYGLINQVAYSVCKTAIMETFRKSLKPLTPYIWTDKLDKAFKDSSLKFPIHLKPKHGILTSRMDTTIATVCKKILRPRDLIRSVLQSPIPKRHRSRRTLSVSRLQSSHTQQCIGRLTKQKR